MTEHAEQPAVDMSDYYDNADKIGKAGEKDITGYVGRYYDIARMFPWPDKWTDEDICTILELITRPGQDGRIASKLDKGAGANLNYAIPPSNGMRTHRLHDPGSKSRSSQVHVYWTNQDNQREHVATLTTLGKRVIWCNQDYADEHGIAPEKVERYNRDVPTYNETSEATKTAFATYASGWDQDN